MVDTPPAPPPLAEMFSPPPPQQTQKASSSQKPSPTTSKNLHLGSSLRSSHIIHLPNIGKNYKIISGAAMMQDCEVIAVVKADAYGHGALKTAMYLHEEHGCKCFAVATLEEAIALREGGIKYPPCRLMVLGAPINHPECFNLYLHHRVETMMSGVEVLESLLQWARSSESRKIAQVMNAASERQKLEKLEIVKSAATLSAMDGEGLGKELKVILEGRKGKAKLISFDKVNDVEKGEAKKNLFFEGKILRYHIMVETGMGRLGLNHNDDKSVQILETLHRERTDNNAPIEFYGLCTHMAEAKKESSYTTEQFKKFKVLIEAVRSAGLLIPTVHCDNSSALLTPQLSHWESEILKQAGRGNNGNSLGFVRCGGGVYGQRPQFSFLKACSTLQSSVSNVAVVKEGETVGYDRTWTAQKDSTIATIAIGFADGLPRELGGGKGSVEINEKLYKIVGNVCMDMLMVNVTRTVDRDGNCVDEEYADDGVSVGDEAVFWGPESQIQLCDIAEKLNTTQSALTCGIDKTRVKTVYV